MFRLVALAILLVLTVLAGAASAQVELCKASGFTPTPGATVCDGAAKPLRVTATVKTYAHLAVERVFGAAASNLMIAMGDIDAECISPASAGIHCTRDPRVGSATWYGDVEFRVKLSGLAATRGKLTALRPSEGSLPADRLVDGTAGTVPGIAYPVSPAAPADLRGGLGNGDTIVTRSLGLTVNGADPPGAWSGAAVYSVVVE